MSHKKCPHEVDTTKLVGYLKHIYIYIYVFEWYVVRCDSKNNGEEDIRCWTRLDYVLIIVCTIALVNILWRGGGNDLYDHWMSTRIFHFDNEYDSHMNSKNDKEIICDPNVDVDLLTILY